MVQETEPRLWQLERYRAYLIILARLHIDPRLQRKFDSSDIVHEALLRAHKKLGQFRGKTEAEFKAWLRRILARTLVNATEGLNKQKRSVRRERSLEASFDAASSRLDHWLASEGTPPSARVAQREQLERLTTALAQLPEEQRQVLELKYLRDFSVAAIANEIQRSPPAVAGLIRRGLVNLRSVLKESR